MKITGLQIHPVSVRRRHKTDVGRGRDMVISGSDAEATVSHFAFLELETDEGITGLGEWSDTIGPGDLGSSTFRLDDDTVPKKLSVAELGSALEHMLVGQDPFRIESIFSDFRFDRSTACAVDSALYDIMGKALSTPVYNLIGGRVRDAVKVSWVVYVRTTDLIWDEMREMVDWGFRAYKLKVGSNIDHDEACVRIIRETAGTEAKIKLDASGSWTVDESIENIKRLEQYDLQGVESPAKGRHAPDVARVREAVDVKIIEHVWDRWDYAMDLFRHDAVDIVNLFPEGCGGIQRCKKVLAVAEAAGVEALLGSTVELGVGTAGQVHLGVSSPAITYSSDLIGPMLYTEDVVTAPFEYADGCLAPPEGPGLGVTLDRVKLAELSESQTRGD